MNGQSPSLSLATEQSLHRLAYFSQSPGVCRDYILPSSLDIVLAARWAGECGCWKPGKTLSPSPGLLLPWWEVCNGKQLAWRTLCAVAMATTQCAQGQGPRPLGDFIRDRACVTAALNHFLRFGACLVLSCSFTPSVRWSRSGANRPVCSLTLRNKHTDA